MNKLMQQMTLPGLDEPTQESTARGRWERVRLEDAFTFIRNGKSIKQSGTDGIPITRIETISNGIVDFSKLGYAGIESIEGNEDYLMKFGDILMSHINSEKHLGKVAIFDSNATVIHGMNLLCLRTESNTNSRYAFYFFNSKIFRNCVLGISNKSVNQASFSVSSLRKLQIPLPPLPEQQRIVARLDKAQQLIDKRKEQLALMDSLVQSLFYEMFGDPVKNEKGWEVKPLGEISTVGTGSTPSREMYSKYYEDGEYAWVKTTEVNGVEIYATEENITQAAIQHTNCKLFPPNTILLAMYGQGKTRGQVGLLKIHASTNQACAAIKCYESVDYRFVYKMLSILYAFIRSLARGGNQENLNLNIVRNIPLILPPLPLQQTFAERVQQIEALKQSMTTSLRELEHNFNSLMQEAFGG